MAKVLFLVHRLSLGFGVSVVVEELSKRLVMLGHRVVIGTLQADHKITGVPIVIVDVNAVTIRNVARRFGVDIVVAHTWPFFDLLPSLRPLFSCWAWEHGDPPPAFFGRDRWQRATAILDKQQNVYPNIDGVIAISEFIRHDIGFPDARVIYNGCDHVPDGGEKTWDGGEIETQRPLKIGTLMRLGRGESKYKGNALFLDVAEQLREAGIAAECSVMGRGSTADADEFVSGGLSVFRNASDEERAEYLRGLDVFISPSQWEGFNLPLVEAMRRGTLAMAFDTGSHPEVCPFVYSNVVEMVATLKEYSSNRALLYEHAAVCHEFVNGAFCWDRAAESFSEIIDKRNQPRIVREVRWLKAGGTRRLRRYASRLRSMAQSAAKLI